MKALTDVYGGYRKHYTGINEHYLRTKLATRKSAVNQPYPIVGVLTLIEADLNIDTRDKCDKETA
jgi:hypothetical protein